MHYQNVWCTLLTFSKIIGQVFSRLSQRSAGLSLKFGTQAMRLSLANRSQGYWHNSCIDGTLTCLMCRSASFKNKDSVLTSFLDLCSILKKCFLQVTILELWQSLLLSIWINCLNTTAFTITESIIGPQFTKYMVQ